MIYSTRLTTPKCNPILILKLVSHLIFPSISWLEVEVAINVETVTWIGIVMFLIFQATNKMIIPKLTKENRSELDKKRNNFEKKKVTWTKRNEVT